MALTNCPECNNQVSDSASTCPHCGFQLNKKEEPIKNTEKNFIEFTGEKTESRIKMLLLGTLFLVGGLAWCLFLLPIGIICIIISIFLFIGGASKNTYKIGKCPYCNNDVLVFSERTTYKCVHCQKISNLTNNGLETI